MSESSESFPRSTCCMTAIAVTDLEMDAQRYEVTAFAGTAFSRSDLPNPWAQASLRSMTRAMESPGIPFDFIVRRTSVWNASRSAAGRRLGSCRKPPLGGMASISVDIFYTTPGAVAETQCTFEIGTNPLDIIVADPNP